MTEIPHFALPFRFVDGRAVVNEQDSYEDVRDCVRAIVSFPQGSRIELPEFGIPDQTFRENGVDAASVRAAVQRWEPRADATAQADNQDLYVLISTLNLELKEVS
jgi:phage baseplate assembly protein W